MSEVEASERIREPGARIHRAGIVQCGAGSDWRYGFWSRFKLAGVKHVLRLAKQLRRRRWRPIAVQHISSSPQADPWTP